MPEIGIAGRNRYEVFEHTGDLKWSVPVNDTSSEITGSSAFDFEADGLSEVVYADQNRLRVFDGVDGTVVFETEVGSGTRLEYPIIADVDVDGKAEIVVVANEALTGPMRGSSSTERPLSGGCRP
ncbi:MAG TPA: VCBS repeat-containing protein, partial [Vicinamibacteria bacterium]